MRTDERQRSETQDSCSCAVISKTPRVLQPWAPQGDVDRRAHTQWVCDMGEGSELGNHPFLASGKWPALVTEGDEPQFLKLTDYQHNPDKRPKQ
jgi:hypothetical protein